MNQRDMENEILKYVSYLDLMKGRHYYQPYIEFTDKLNDGYEYITSFEVESERTTNIYDVEIRTDTEERKISDTYCSCPQFSSTGSCKHVAACMYYYFDEIFPREITEKMRKKITDKIFDVIENINNNPNTKKVKKEVSIEVYLFGNNMNDRIDSLDIELKIGTDKLYSCKRNKLKQFLSAYDNHEEMDFGKLFTYSPEEHYFSEANQKLLSFLSIMLENDDRYYTSDFIIGRHSVKQLLEILSDRKYYLNGHTIQEIKKGFPLATKLIKENDNYKLSFILNENLYFITGDLEYIQTNKGLYRLGEKDRTLLENLISNDIVELSFDEKAKNKFSKSVLPIVYKDIDIDEKIDDFKISKEISTKLYFDLNQNKILCNCIFCYDEDEISYFDKTTSVLRDSDYEQEVINDLYHYHFQIDNNQIFMDELDKIGTFIESDLAEISEKYKTFTSENFKKVKVLPKTSVKSTFSIGKDNIMSFSFDMGEIKENEVVNVLKALKKKKKYYRLKSGDILNLENSDELEEFNDLMDDLNISDKEIEKGDYIIPKYRAIYLDSLKNNKYHIIKTNNLFDELIEKFNLYKNQDISLSSKEKKILRDYQKDGVKWLYNIDKTGFGGILADEMGLGKSIQTIYYIKELLKENKDYKFLIICPTSLAYNWENEFNKFEPKMKKVIMVGTRAVRREKFDNEVKNANVIITTYGLVREDKSYYDNLEFKTVIIDEGQNIKNHNAQITKAVKSIHAETKFALTGTPIENSIDELWSIFDFIMPGFLPDLMTFDQRYKIKDFDDDTLKKMKSLNQMISPFILRRRKREVIKDLPDKIENNIYVDLNDEQKKIYLAELDKVHKKMDEILSSGEASKFRFLILQLLTKLRQICIDPKIVYPDYKGGSSKLEEFRKVMKTMTQNGHKILVFTSFREALKLAKKEIEKDKLTSYTIDGSVSSKERMRLVDKFNSDSTNVFFIMLKAGGTGLNLTSADVVVHLDLWWNPQAENQATDRAHRIGQKNTVEVIHFISKGTIEERILELQQKKKLLSEKLIDDQNPDMVFDKLSDEDIKNLLAYHQEEK